MIWLEAKVVFESEEIEVCADLIGNIFMELGVKGVVVESPDMDPPEGWGDDAGALPENNAVIGYIPKNDLHRDRCLKLEESVGNLEKENPIKTRISYREIHEEDWAESWKEYFYPEKVTENIVVKPTWRDYTPAAGETVIEIDPGMAFGTGAHPTTSLCMELMEKYVKPGSSLLDVGTGSGVLMIAGAKLGAKKLLGVDFDEVAVEIAKKNLSLNKVSGAVVEQGDLISHVKDKFDVIAANILSEVIILLLDDAPGALKEGGVFICSGIIEENKDQVIDKMAQMGLVPLEVRIKERWVAIAGARAE